MRTVPLVSIFGFLFLTAGCANTVSDEALYVKVVTASDGCNSLGMVTGRSPPFALTPSDEQVGAMNSALNAVGKKGGNAIVVLNAQQTAFGGGVVQGEAFDCASIDPKRVINSRDVWN